MTKILLIDTQPLTQIGLSQIIEGQGLTVDITGDDDFNRIDRLIAEKQPDLLIADPFFDPCFSQDDLARVMEKHPVLPVLVIFNQLQRTDIMKLVDAGLQCMLSKAASQQEVITALETTLLKKKYFCKQTTHLLFGTGKDSETYAIPPLSAREKEIIHLIAEGLPDTAIAQKLFLSFHTVRTHRKNISKKLGFSLKNAGELVWLIRYLNELI